MQYRFQGIKYLALALATVLLAACASAPAPLLEVPKMAEKPSHVMEKAPPVQSGFSHMLQPLDENNSIFYHQNFGGSVGIGILFGPLGVLANVKAVESMTLSETAMIKGKIPVDPQAIAKDVATTKLTLLESAKPAGAVKIIPTLDLVRLENNEIAIGCALTVDYRNAGPKWQGRYIYQLPFKYKLAELSQGLSTDQARQLQVEVRQGFETLFELYGHDLDHLSQNGAQIRFKSDFMSPRFTFETYGAQLPSAPDRINVRQPGVVYSLPRALITIVQ